LVGIRKDIKLDFTMHKKIELKKELKDFLGYDGKITSINKQIGYTIRIGGRKSKIGNKHNWDGYLINNSPYYLSASDCMRLMGFSNSDYKKLSQAGIIDSAICKVAGNSVVVDVLEHIFRSLFNHKNANR
jgi:DNA (cytosine-5)-methyltransferase 1